eukprot:4520643-Pyramimonas_sp.AAC.1
MEPVELEPSAFHQRAQRLQFSEQEFGRSDGLPNFSYRRLIPNVKISNSAPDNVLPIAVP